MPKSRVYRNLNKKCWSRKVGRDPVLHHDSLTLVDCEFVVQEGGRQRVLRERRKCVHAFCKGTYAGPADPSEIDTLGMKRVSYSPYRNPDKPGSFFVKETGEDVTRARRLVFLPGGALYAQLEQ